MSDDYIFSATIKRPVLQTVIKRRPWWNLFGRDTLITKWVSQWVRKSMGINEAEAKWIQSTEGTFPANNLFLRALADDQPASIRDVRLIQNSFPTSYIQTTGSTAKNEG